MTVSDDAVEKHLGEGMSNYNCFDIEPCEQLYILLDLLFVSFSISMWSLWYLNYILRLSNYQGKHQRKRHVLLSQEKVEQKIVVLRLDAIFYNQILRGEKRTEYRNAGAYWTPRLSGVTHLIFQVGFLKVLATWFVFPPWVERSDLVFSSVPVPP